MTGGRQLDGTGMKRLHRSWRPQTAGRIGLILDGLSTPVNVGSIIRTAAAYRVDTMWLAGATPGPEHPGVVKTALGCERYLHMVSGELTGPAAIEQARQAGYRVVALEFTDTARALHTVDLGPDVCLVVGHEDHGVSKPSLAAVDGAVFLPLVGKIGSLNVATAASIAIYELRRQSWTAASDAPGIDVEP
jgi:tRNA (guanosine-2'-O-)-methyltransferase